MRFEEMIRRELAQPDGALRPETLAQMTALGGRIPDSPFPDDPFYGLYSSEKEMVSDISGIEALENLETLKLSIDGGDSREIIAGISSLKHLKRLFLWANGVRTIGWLKALPNLRELHLFRMEIEDADAIGSLQQLTNLHIAQCRLDHVRGIGQLPMLERLALEDNTLREPFAFAGGDRLRICKIYGVEADNCAWMRKIQAVTHLSLARNSFSDISGIETLGNLETLELFGNTIDLRPLQGLRKLKRLSISSPELRDLTPIAALENLETLFVCGNDLRDISVLQGLRRLRFLSLSNNPIPDAQIAALKAANPALYVEKVP